MRPSRWEHSRGMSRFRRRRLSSQIFAFQALILALTLLLGCLLALRASQQRLDDESEHRALAVAESVAAEPEIARAVVAGNPGGIVQARAEAVRKATGVSFVVVTDRRGIRFSHPDPAKLGKRVSTDPGPALHGRTVLAVQTGTLGRSARAKIPLRTPDRRIVGEVSVGIVERTIREQLADVAPVIALYGAIALAAGLLASMVLAARLKRQTFGLELDELADLLQEREATLRGIREGVVAVDRRGRVRVVNDEAWRLLEMPRDAVGRPVDEIAGDSRLTDMLAGRLQGRDLILLHGDRVLVANHMPVCHEGTELGGVTTLRDRTELEGLLRELDSVRGLTEAMRAQAHEFSNRLHTLSGLLQLGHQEEALSFIKEIAHADAALRDAVTERIADPLVGALLLAKSAVAGERGVELQLVEATQLDGELRDPRAVLTVLGNLIDNAVDAARTSGREPAAVEVGLRLLDDDVLAISVADSGAGIPADERERIFEPGYSTKPTAGAGSRGVGLALVQRMVERRGGSVTVGEAAHGGALFDVRLPVVLRPAVEARA
jgi:two-component system CitB family sensor kinase